MQLQWLPATVYPNLIASLGIEGWFRLWAEDPSAAPGRRFATSRSVTGRPAFDTRSSTKAPYRSFSMRHVEDSRQTYLALLAADGKLTVYENDQPENLTDYASIDEFSVCPKPSRGEEVAFTVRFDPNPEPCYNALRAGVASDSLGLVVAGMDSVRIYRSRETVATSYGVQTAQREFYLAVDVQGHRGLVRDVAWAPGNIRGYDIIATACQDGYARVFRIDTPYSSDDGKSWSAAALLKPETAHIPSSREREKDARRAAASASQEENKQHQHSSTLSASLAKADPSSDRSYSGLPGQVRHTCTEISKLDSHRTPVWRVGFDDDGQILGTTGDDGRLLCHRQKPDGTWAKSSEMTIMRTRMAAP